MKRSEFVPSVLLHSDDAGGTRAGSAGIVKAWRDGNLDGFSVFANGEALDELRASVAAAPERPLRLMVHLNLSEGASSAPPAQVPLLVDDRGELRMRFGLLLGTWLFATPGRRRKFLAQVEVEWRAQVQKICELFAPRRPDGVDGHIHVHMLPFLFPIAARLASEFGLARVRLVREPIYMAGAGTADRRMPTALNLVKNLVLRCCSLLCESRVRSHGLQAPDRVIGVLYSGEMTARAAESGLAAAIADGAREVEVMFHVGRAEDTEAERWSGRADIAEFNVSPSRDAEREELTRFNTLLVARGWRRALP